MKRRRQEAAAGADERERRRQGDLFDQPPPIDFDVQAGRARRDAGIALVERHADVHGGWKDEARQLVERVVSPGWEGLSEDIRVMVLEAGLPAPHSPNCWGALTLWAVKRGLLEATGELDHMRDPRSHARYTKRYRRVVLS